MSVNRQETEVIVIGAGVAGLAAGAALRRAQIRTLIVEARDRVGGRIFTDRSLGVPIDMGAASIHGAEGNPITELANAAGVETSVSDFDSFVCYGAGGVLIDEHRLEASEAEFTAFFKGLKRHAAQGETLAETISRTAPEALTDPLMRMHAATEFEFDVGGSLHELSACELDEDEEFEGDDLYLPRGYDHLAEAMATGLNIQLDRRVTGIRAELDHVVVQTTNGMIAADYAICTLPLGVLKTDNVSFHPPLPPAITDAIARIGVGHATKVAMRFGEMFWEREAHYIGYAGGGEIGRFPYFLNLDATHPGSKTLVTFAVGFYGQQIQQGTDEAAKADVMNVLQDIYGPAATEPKALIVSRWSQDPFSQGSYSFAAVDSRRCDFEAFEGAAHDRLFFGGEHANADYRGTVHGAYLSGVLAAENVIDLLR